VLGVGCGFQRYRCSNGEIEKILCSRSKTIAKEVMFSEEFQPCFTTVRMLKALLVLYAPCSHIAAPYTATANIRHL